MDELSAVGAVADRLVGGMMFHSDHADLMRFLGLHGFAGMHEEGFGHDARALRKVRRRCVSRLGRVPPQGQQERGSALDKVAGHASSDLNANDRYRLAVSSLDAWARWERDTAAAMSDAASSLDGTLRRLVARLQRGAEREADEASRLLAEARACDMAHLYDMQR